MPNCGICKMAKQKMTEKGIPFEEYDLEKYAEELDIMTAPVIDTGNGELLTGAGPIVNWINEHKV